MIVSLKQLIDGDPKGGNRQVGLGFVQLRIEPLEGHQLGK
jgi:hypothetical protein